MIHPGIASRLAPADSRCLARRIGALAFALCALAACAPTSGAKVVGNLRVHLRDFAIDISHTELSAGRITIDVTNLGPTTHEFNLDRTDLDAASLPRKPDGLTVWENSPELQRVTSIEGVGLGVHRRISVVLPPGHYVLYCNLEGHYLGSMHTQIDVTGPRTPS